MLAHSRFVPVGGVHETALERVETGKLRPVRLIELSTSRDENVDLFLEPLTGFQIGHGKCPSRCCQYLAPVLALTARVNRGGGRVGTISSLPGPSAPLRAYAII